MAQQAGLGSGVVLLGGAVGTWIGGRVTDSARRARHGLRIGRSIGVVALPLSGLLLLVDGDHRQPDHHDRFCSR